MLKKSITFEDYSEPPQEVTRDFYFNFTKLEVIEMLEVDDLEGTLKRLQETENGPEAYALFKKIILSAYGEKNADGGFDKKDAAGNPLSRKFESLPACDELIIGFLQDPLSGGAFVEACLPAKLVREAKEAQKNNPSKQQIEEMVATAAARQEDPATAIEPGTDLNAPKKFEDYSEEELLAMSDDDFAKIVPVHSPKDMTQPMLLVAFARKSKRA